MKFLEKDLEQIIYEADKAELLKKGLRINGKLFRQKKIGNYGICDLLSVDRDGGMLRITIFELKKENVSASTFLQAVGYAKGVSSYLGKRGIPAMVDIVLIGKNIDTGSTLCYLPDLCGYLQIYTYDYGLEGISFKYASEYKLVNEGFDNSKFKPF